MRSCNRTIVLFGHLLFAAFDWGICRFRQVYSKIMRTNVGRMDPMLWKARQMEGAPRNQCRFGPPDPNIAQTDPTRLDQT